MGENQPAQDRLQDLIEYRSTVERKVFAPEPVVFLYTIIFCALISVIAARSLIDTTHYFSGQTELAEVHVRNVAEDSMFKESVSNNGGRRVTVWVYDLVLKLDDGRQHTVTITDPKNDDEFGKAIRGEGEVRVFSSGDRIRIASHVAQTHYLLIAAISFLSIFALGIAANKNQNGSGILWLLVLFNFIIISVLCGRMAMIPTWASVESTWFFFLPASSLILILTELVWIYAVFMLRAAR